MWLFLPDEGVSPEEVTADVMDFLATPHQDGIDRKFMEIRLSLPKFDICGDAELSETLKKLGITHIFDSSQADFTPIYPEENGAAVNAIQHAARVHIDEQGVTAAAFTVILEAGAAMPPEEIIDFKLDRPFLFVVEKDNIPLFTGVVNEP
jgi:serine protease inhibitor